MLAVDTNILYPAVQADHEDNAAAADFIRSLHGRDDVAMSEFVLVELYNLLRNPAILDHPLDPSAAAATCNFFRSHMRWNLIGFPPDSRSFHDELWLRLADAHFPRRRLYDLRTALSLLEGGATEFATANVKDFEGVGFARVWNPLAA